MFQIRYGEKTPPIGAAIRARARDRHTGGSRRILTTHERRHFRETVASFSPAGSGQALFGF